MHYNSKWYALFVLTGEEDRVKERIEYRFKYNNDMRVLVPKRRLRERKNGKWDYKIRTMFPGYVLLNGYIGIDEYYSLKEVPGVVTILKDKSRPLEIPEYEISVVSRLMCNREIIDSSNVYMEGGRVVVVDGPLLGLDGLIESVDHRKGRAKVRLNFMGEPRTVELSVAFVQSA